MRKLFVLLLVSFVAVLVLNESGVFDALFIFLLSGSLPGTPIALSSQDMLIIIGFISLAIVVRMAILGAFNMIAVRKSLLHRHSKAKRLPKHRYSRI